MLLLSFLLHIFVKVYSKSMLSLQETFREITLSTEFLMHRLDLFFSVSMVSV